MRKQSRPPMPEFLETNGPRWNQQWAELKSRSPSASFAWYSIDGQTARELLLDHLGSMNQNHCSFCDGFPLEGTSKTPIEHFRPKSIYHSEAYSWENLYYSCECCQAEKREQWDELLLRPDAPDYEFTTCFAFDFTTGAIIGNPVADPETRTRAEKTISIYGLDDEMRRRRRKLELRRWQRSSSPFIDEWGYRDFLELDPEQSESAAPGESASGPDET